MSCISISNLAWLPGEDEKNLKIMSEIGVLGLEVSPFREAKDLSLINLNTARSLLSKLKKYNIKVVALQAILYRFNELALFEDEYTRNKMYKHFIGIIDFASYVGAKSIVYGAPKSKLRGKISYERAFDIAVVFFSKLAEYAKRKNVIVCLEPTPLVYGADFVCNVEEAVSLIKSVGIHSSFKLNLDLGSLIVNKESVLDIFNYYSDFIGHIHVSEPYLKPIKLNDLFHSEVFNAMSCSGRDDYTVSIEMLPIKGGIEEIKKILRFVKNVYSL